MVHSAILGISSSKAPASREMSITWTENLRSRDMMWPSTPLYLALRTLCMAYLHWSLLHNLTVSFFHGRNELLNSDKASSFSRWRAGSPIRQDEATASGGRIHRGSRSRCKSLFPCVPDVDLHSPLHPGLLHWWGENHLVVRLRCQNALG